MSESPEQRNKDSKKASGSNIENEVDPPMNKTDPTEPVTVGGAKEGKGAAAAGL